MKKLALLPLIFAFNGIKAMDLTNPKLLSRPPQSQQLDRALNIDLEANLAGKSNLKSTFYSSYGHQININPIHPLSLKACCLLALDKNDIFIEYGRWSKLPEELRDLIDFTEETKLRAKRDLLPLRAVIAKDAARVELFLGMLSHEGCCQMVNELAYTAASNGNDEALAYLLTKITDVNTIKYYRNDITPLWEAADKGHLACVKLLVVHGATINAECKNSLPWPATYETALMAAARNGHAEIVAFLKKHGGMDLAMIQAQKEAAAQQEAARKKALEPRFLAEAAIGNVEAVRRLLDEGVNYNCTDSQGRTALQLARQNNYQDVVTMLRLFIMRRLQNRVLEHNYDAEWAGVGNGPAGVTVIGMLLDVD